MKTYKECRKYVKKAILTVLTRENEPVTVAYLAYGLNLVPFDMSIQFVTSCLNELVKSNEVKRLAILSGNQLRAGYMIQC